MKLVVTEDPFKPFTTVRILNNLWKIHIAILHRRLLRFLLGFLIYWKKETNIITRQNPYYSDLYILLSAHLYTSTFYIFCIFQVNCLSSPRLSTPEERESPSYTPPCAQSLGRHRTHNMLSAKAYQVLD